MTAAERPIQAVDPRNPHALVTALISELHRRDLQVKGKRTTNAVILHVIQPAASGGGDTIEGGLANVPALSQTVVLTPDSQRRSETRAYAWSWVWGSEFRSAGDPETERFGAGEDIRPPLTRSPASCASTPDLGCTRLSRRGGVGPPMPCRRASHRPAAASFRSRGGKGRWSCLTFPG